jgi:ribonuclease BN (tRNA processing enzyme)
MMSVSVPGSRKIVVGQPLLSRLGKRERNCPLPEIRSVCLRRNQGLSLLQGGKSVVYATDGEHEYDCLDDSYPFVEFCRSADLLIFDAMYSFGDTVSVKEHWGHSSNVVAVELAQAARVKRLALFHHDPVLDDPMLEVVLADTMRFEAISRRGAKVDVISAYDGLELTV